MVGNPLCLLTLLRDYPLLCRLLPKTWSLKHYLGTLKPLPLFVYRFLILYFSFSASALLAPQLSYVALSLNNDYVEIAFCSGNSIEKRIRRLPISSYRLVID